MASSCLLHTWFEKTVARFPNRVAVSLGDQSWTYSALNDRADQIARALRANGAGPEVPVAICLERSLELVASLIGILKAGSAYVPVDLSYPAERLAFMLEDTGAPILLTQHQLAARLPEHRAKVICLDDPLPETHPHAGVTAHPALTDDSLAYILYTSGSTGRPKGCCVTHRNVARLFTATEPWFQFREDDVWTLFHSTAFDFSVWEMWGALLYGGRLVVVPHAIARAPEEFLSLLAGERVTVLNQTPSAFRQLMAAVQALPQPAKLALRYVIFGGEALEMRCLQPWFARHGDQRPQLVNMYGITETTVHVTYRPLKASDVTSGSVIGVPIPDLQVHLFDEQTRPCPPGVAGEMFVSGAGVARGYWKRPELTAERFIASPFTPGEILYRSGDLARRRADGELEYLGRLDQQVKIRGFRVELGEIESALVQHPTIREAVVLARGVDDNLELRAFLVLRGGAPSLTDLRASLSRTLPDYMVPGVFVIVDRIPLTPNGKTDREALMRMPGQLLGDGAARLAPHTALEASLLDLWRAVLRREEVGTQDDFFALGGHSLLAMQVAPRAARLVGVKVPVGLLFQHPNIESYAHALEQLAAEPPPQIPASTNEPSSGADYPLTPLQQGMLFHHLLTREAGVDIGQVLCDLPEAVDPAKLEHAWTLAIARHEGLRARFRWENLPEPRQEFVPSLAARLDLEDWRSHAKPEQDRRLEELLAADRRRGFDLGQAPLFRLKLLRLADAEFRLLWTFHHALLDDRGFELVLREVFTSYTALRRGEQPALPAPPRLGDYLQWLTSVADPGAGEFWRKALKGFTQPTPLAVERRPAAEHQLPRQQADAELRLPAALTNQLQVFARANGLSLGTLIRAAWALLLNRYSGEPDVVFGAIHSDRQGSVPNADGVVGPLWNTLPVRIAVRNEAGLLPWLRELEHHWQAAAAHASVSLAAIQGWSEVPPGRSLFETLVDVQEFDLESSLQRLGGDGSRRHFRFFGQPVYPLTLAAYPAEELRLKAEFDPTRLDHETVRRLLGHLRNLLEAWPANGQLTLGEIPLLSTAEQELLLSEWNQTRAEFPRGERLQQLFEAQVERTPDAVALEFGQARLSYRELNRRANGVAHHLRTLGVGPDVLVGLYLERSLEMVVGLLGILKAGGAFVPVAPEYPAERVAFMLADADAPVVLTQSALAPQLSALNSHPKILALDDPATFAGSQDPGNPVSVGTDEALAYVLYTSGSTGQPKGVMIPHRAIVNHMRWMQSAFPLGPEDCVLQKTPFSFDASVWEFFAPLLAGARLALAAPGAHRDPARMVAAVNRHRVTILQLVPSVLGVLLEHPGFAECRQLRRVFVGGEALTSDLVRRFQGTLAAELHNLYGPTEVTIDSVVFSLPPRFAEPVVPIGRPVANTTAYVLDAAGRPVPVGVPGELFLGGEQVGRGYHRQADLTAERFLPDPFSATPDAVLYRTGDQVRYRPDGNLEFLGRLDGQIKLNGFRIELGEIEATLLAEAGVRRAAVAVKDAPGGVQALVAYLVPAGGESPDTAKLRLQLHRRLPAFMVPSAFVLLEDLPLLPNGKLNRSALPNPQATPPTPSATDAPLTPLQARLARIWQTVLGVEHVGPRDNFYALGGQSLLAMRLVAEIQRALGCRVSLGDFLRKPTVAELATLVTPAGGGSSSRVRATDPVATYPLAPMQLGMLSTSLLQPGTGVDLEQITWRMPDSVIREAFVAAWRWLATRHDVLRTSFRWEDVETPVQEVWPEVTPLVEELDWQALTPAAREAGFKDWLAADRCRGVSLDTAPLWRVALLREAEAEWRVVWTIHHALVDGRTLTLLLQELSACYQSLCAGRTPDTPLPPSFQQHVEWLGRLDLQPAERYWRSLLEGTRPVVNLAAGVPASGADAGGFRESRAHRLTDELRATIQRQAKRSQVSPAGLVQLAWALLLARETGLEEVVFGATRASRQSGVPGAMAMTGVFINTLPVRLRLSPGSRVAELLCALRGQHRAAREHEHTPLARIQEWCNAGQALFDSYVMFDRRGWDAEIGEACAALGARDGAILEAPSFPLGLLAYDAPAMELKIYFDPVRFSGEAIERMLRSLEGYLAALATNPESAIAGLPLPELPPAESRLRFDVPRPAVRRASLPAGPAELRARTHGGPARLSAEQERLWFLHHSLPQPAAYNVPLMFRLRGALDLAALEQAFLAVAAQQEALRTRIVAHDGEPFAEVVALPGPVVRVVDLRGTAAADREQAAQSHFITEFQRPFELGSAPLWRVTCLRFAADDHALILVAHHLICDEWSLRIWLGEVEAAYATWLAGEHAATARPPVQYADYAAWQRARLTPESQAPHLDYWKRQLADAPPELHLPCDHKRPRKPTLRGGLLRHALSAKTMAALNALGRAEQATVFMLVTAAWQAFLARVAGTHDVVVACPLAQRGQPELGQVIGFFLNTVPIRARVNRQQSFRELLRAVRLTVLEALEHGSLPFDEIVRACGGASGRGAAPLMQVMLVVNSDLPRTLTLGGAQGEAVEAERTLSKTDLTLFVSEVAAGGWQAALEFSRELFEPTTIERMLLHFSRWLDAAASEPDAALGRLELLPDEERQQILQHFSHGPRTWETVMARLPHLHLDRRHSRGDPPLRRCYVLDAELRPVPIGFLGELCISEIPTGPSSLGGLARKVQALIADPFTSEPGAWFFRTGEPCRWRANGALEFPERARQRHAPESPPAAPAADDPRNATETKLAAVWCEVLGRERVGLHENFFALGGHSLLAMRVAARLTRELGHEVSVRLLFDSPTIAELAAALTGTLLPHSGARIASVPRDGPLPVSHEQERLWFLHQILARPAAYNVTFAARLRGNLDLPRFERAWQRLARRHEILRMKFVAEEGVVRQVAVAELGPIVSIKPLTEAAPEARAAELQTALEAEAARPFDLAIAPLLRVTGWPLADAEHVVAITLHHLICDEWSTRLLWAELAQLYEADSDAAGLAPLAIQYADYAAWQRARTQSAALESQRDYWRTQLAGAPSALDLPADHARASQPTCRGAQVPFEIEAALVTALQPLAAAEGVTPSMLWLALFSALLHRLSGQDDLLIGVPLAQRGHAEVQSLVGFFLNTVPVRSRAPAADSFRAHLQHTRALLLGAVEHGELPLDEILREHPETRAAHRQSLLQTLFVMLNESPPPLKLAGLDTEPLSVDPGTAKFDLTLFLTETGTGSLAGMFEFSADLFERGSVERLAGHLKQLARAAAAQPELGLWHLELLPAEQRQLVVEEFNRTTASFQLPGGVEGLFEAQVRQTPDSVALLCEGTSLTYAELEQRANDLAAELRRLGVGPDVLVGLCLDRSPHVVAAVLATLKAGGACLPLDPSYPAERLRFMLEDVQPAVLLTQTSLAARLPASQTPRLLLDTWQPSGAVTGNPPPQRDLERLAYVLFTSGSTGRPKGVGMPQRALLNLIAWQLPQSRCGVGDRTLQFASLSFDVSFQELFATLASGGTLVLISDACRRDLRALAAVIHEQRVARLFVPFVVLDDLAALLVEMGGAELALKEIITAGEQLRVTPALVKLFEQLPNAVLVNQYGPTETHVVTAHTLTGAPAMWPALPPIGRPIANTHVYVLDARGQPAPIGVPGELHLGGAQVARGYLNRPELTAERFIPNPFSARPDARLYRTGDRCRWLPGGDLEFLGRLDDQVKIRGFRIELGEIEAALSRHPGVRQAAVIARDGAGGARELVAFVAGHNGASPTVESLRGELRAALPDYMVPARFVVLDALPFGPNGKVDRRLLAAREEAEPVQSRTAAAPTTEAEAGLVAVWSGVLGRRGIGVDSDFFELGGHSLLALRLMREVEKRFGRSLPLASLFAAPTIRQFARLLEDQAAPMAAGPAGRLRGRSEGAPLFYVPGIYGYEFLPEAVARQVGEVRPFYDGLQYPGLDDHQQPLESVEALAAHLIAQMEQVAPSGPLFLGGYSFGGVVGYEMARQLRARGRPVEAVLLIDSFAPVTFRKRSALETVGAVRRHLATMSTRERVTFLARHARRKAGALRRGLTGKLSTSSSQGVSITTPPAPVSDAALRKQHVADVSLAAYRNYRPLPYEGRVVLFQVIEREFQIGLRYVLDPHNGWREFVRGGLEVVTVPGDHNTVLQAPAIHTLAAKVVEVLTARR